MDDEISPRGRPKLPPLTEGDAPRRKKKKRLPQPRLVDEEHAPPVRDRGSDGDDPTTRPAPRKKKTRQRGPPPEPELTPRYDDDLDPGGERVPEGRRRNRVRKTIDQDPGTPDGEHPPPERRKKKKRRRSQEGRTRPATDSGDDYYPSEFDVADEDIVDGGTVDDRTQDIALPTFHPSTAPSQATNKMFLETKSGFISEKKSQLAKARDAQSREPEVVDEQEEGETIRFAVGVAKFMHTVGLIVQGLVAGIALWHLVAVYILKNISDYALLEYYEALALPVQCMFYVALVICVISSSDKCDLASPQGGFSRAIITFQTGAITALVYVIALIVSLCMASTDDEMGLYTEHPNVWMNGYYTTELGVLMTSVATPALRPAMVSRLGTWMVLNVIRAVCVILCWLINANDPETNHTIDHLKLMDDSVNRNDHEHWATKSNPPV